MKSVCFFASYFNGKKLPYYLKVYIKELKKHFSEVVLLCSQNELEVSEIEFLKLENIQLIVEKNEGFDFGLWYKAFQKYDMNSFDQVALVNDSCILFKPLDKFINWSISSSADLKGMTQSYAIAPHVQSYFLVLNKRAIKYTADYFSQNKILRDIFEVINTYEVGLSTYLISKGLKIDSFIDNNGYKGEFSPYYFCIDYQLSKGISLIKKKILFSSYRKDELLTLARMDFNISQDYYIKKIKENNQDLIIDFDIFKTDKGIKHFSLVEIIEYKLKCTLIKIVRLFRKKTDYAKKNLL